jgi:membrane associated rhomboid family serine protease
LFSLSSSTPVVGASGAIYGVLLAYGLMFPNRLVYLYFLIPY